MTFTHHLERHFPGLAPMDADAGTVAEVLEGVDRARPGLRDWLVDEHGRLRPHVNVFVGGRQVRDRVGLSDEVAPGDEVFVLQALSGG